MVKTLMWLVGGLSVALGIAIAATTHSFGVAQGDIASHFSELGFDGLDNLEVFQSGKAAILLFLAGIGTMAAATSNAYKETGGY